MFASKVRASQIGFMGEPKEVKLGKGGFYENPDSCICENAAGSGSGITTRGSDRSDPDYGSGDEEPAWRDSGYGENVPLGKSLPNRTEMDYDPSVSSEEPELDPILSD